MENEIAAIEKQLDYIEKRARKNVHEITVTRFDLSQSTVDYYKNNKGYKIIFNKRNIFSKGENKKSFYTITRYIHKEI